MNNDVYNQDNLLIRRKFFKVFGEELEIFTPDGNIVLFAKLKAFKIKEDIRIFTGHDMQKELIRIKARNIFDIATTYDIFDSTTDQRIGALKRKGLKSIVRDEWNILDINDQPIGMIQEESGMLALVRRFITNLIPQEFHGFIGNVQVLHFKQNFNPFISKIQMDFSTDTNKVLDRRIGIAAGVILNAVEGKQS